MSTQMWPANDGSNNSASFNGRTYASVPGVSIDAQDFDAAVLEPNGWTSYATIAGKTTITMLPPSAGGYIAFNGRIYVSAPGVPLEVPPFDAPTLEANGWIRSIAIQNRLLFNFATDSAWLVALHIAS